MRSGKVTSDGRAGAWRPRVDARWRDLVCGITVLAIAVKSTSGIARVRDLWLNDETAYLAAGVRLMTPGFPNGDRGLPEAAASPLYSCWYALLHLVIRDPARLYDFNWSLMLALTSVANYALQRKLDVAPEVALLFTFLLATSAFFDVWPYPCEFTLLVLSSGLVLVLSRRSARWRGILLVVMLAMCVFVRPELFMAFVLVAASTGYLAVRAMLRRRLSAPEVARDAAVVVLGAGLPFVIFGNPLAGGRSLFAWSQHYALGQAMRHRTDLNPWLNTREIVTRDFGPITSISDALRANPRAFLSNMSFNLRLLPSRLADLVQPNPFASSVAGYVVLGALVGLSAFASLSIFALRRGDLTRDGSRRTVFGLWVALVTASFTDVLVIHPRLHYLQIPVGIGIALVASGLRPAASLVRRWRRSGVDDADRAERRIPAWGLILLAGLLLVITPNRAYGFCPQTALGLAPIPQWPFPKVRETVQAVRDLGLKRPVVVLEQGYSYVFYSKLDFARVAEWTKSGPFAEFMRQNDVGLVILSSELAENGAFSSDPEYRAFAGDPESFGFRVLPVPGTTTRIALRNDYAPDRGGSK